MARGFDPQKPYQLNGLDSINVMTGNLVITIAIGQTYPVGSHLSYGLHLVYNGNPWNYRIDGATTEAIPSRFANVGLGWQLTLGELIGPNDPLAAQIQDGGNWVYAAPDGAERVFYPVLHPEELGDTNYEASSSPAVGGVAGYTRDSSYLRLVRLAPVYTGTHRIGPGEFEDLYRSVYRLEFPDGTMHTFTSRDEIGVEQFTQPSAMDERGLRYRLTRMEDRFGNWVNVAYVDGSNPNWTITDSVGRSQTVTLQPRSFYDYQGSPQSRDTVTQVNLAAFDGQRAIYNFNVDSSYTTISKPCADNNYQTDRTTRTLFLRSVGLPDGSSYSMDQYEAQEPGSPVPCIEYAGHLLRWTLPTGGHIQYTVGQRRFPGTKEDGGGALGEVGPPTQHPAAISTRTVSSDLAPGSSQTSWYVAHLMNFASYQPDGSHSGPYQVAQDMVVLVTSPVTGPLNAPVTGPLSRTTASYFYLPQESPEYGLPFCSMSGTADGDYHLSTESYDGACTAWNALGRTCSNSTGPLTPARSTSVQYARDTFYTTDSTRQVDQNRRLLATKTRFFDDQGCPACATESLSSDFDGLGHYRTETTTSTFPGTLTRVTATHYNANSNAGTYPPAVPTDRTNYMIAANSPWLLGLFDEASAIQGSEPAVVERYCFDRTKGLLQGKRTLSHGCDASQECPNDLLAVFSDTNGDGNIDYESYFGGDTQPIGTSLACNASLGAPKYQLTNLWSNGVLASQQYSGATFNSVDLTIDPSTGLPKESYDTARMLTTYSYDALGRVVAEYPPYEAWSEYQYTRYTDAAHPVSVSLRAHSLSAGSPILREERLYFDGLGRAVMQKKRMPDASGVQQWSTVRTSYDSLGRRSSVNVPIFRPTGEWETLPSGFGTAFVYDRFDRPTLVQQPDGHSTLTAYAGSRQITRTLRVATESNGDGSPAEHDAVTTQTYDGYGRLLSVTEGSGPNGADVTTGYIYDVGNRLRTAATSDSGVTQSRSFTYDGRGLLLSEQHPESGLTIFGASATAAAYDARGHATRKLVGTQDLRFTYDGAERLTAVQSADTGGIVRTLKTFTYGTENLGPCNAIDNCEARNGKLLTATRHNYDPLFGDITVSEDYKYYGRGGRIAERSTAVSSATAFDGASFVTRRSWNEQGLLDTIDYPSTSATGPLRYVGYTYDQGMLTGVNGYGTLAYQPTGLTATIAHANGVTETWDADPRGMQRPARIRAQVGAQTLWDSGTYAYDGAGNITTIGGGAYRYDKVGRLTYEANPFPEGLYTYDAFGNRTGSTIAHVNGDVFGRVTTTIPVDSSTNRLQGTALYDTAGNLTQWAVDDTFTYDPASMVTTHNAAGRTVHYLYTADDERIAAIERLLGTDQALHNKTTWTLRSPEDQVLRVFTDDAASGTRVWNWQEDEIWRGASLLANESSLGVRHYALDHLGSPRLLTSATGSSAGAGLGAQDFSAFGEGGATDAGALEFTGHERDWSHGPAGWGETFDYMHARYYAPSIGRFLSTDPVRGSLNKPQSWNRDTYVRNNPLVYTDPSGMQLHVWAQKNAESQWNADPLTDTAKELLSFHWALQGAQNGLQWIQDHPYKTAYHVANIALILTDPGLGAVEEGVGEAGYVVYEAVDDTGEVIYVGITNNLRRRAVEQLAANGIRIKGIPGAENLTRLEARGVEQVLIERYGLGGVPWQTGQLLNKINSLARINPKYGPAIEAGKIVLQRIGYTLP
jgi:RHS repeat-associated protein